MEDFCTEKLAFEPDWLLYQYVVWPLNLGNWHWVVAVFNSAPGSTIYYIDTLNGTDKQAVKDSIPENLYSILSCLGKSVVPPI